jgi:methylthioribose-1-phosphate isomerase
MLKTLEWTDSGIRFLDQTKLPTEETYVNCETYEDVAVAIRDMIVRGAPAIGVAAAMGIALGVKHSDANHVSELRRHFDDICETITSTRPTAVNLFWAADRMRRVFDSLQDQPVSQIKQSLITEAQRMYVDTLRVSHIIGTVTV